MWLLAEKSSWSLNSCCVFRYTFFYGFHSVAIAAAHRQQPGFLKNSSALPTNNSDCVNFLMVLERCFHVQALPRQLWCSMWVRWVSQPWLCFSSFRRYDNYKIGTFLLCQSTSRAFEVHVRQWDCGGHRSATACNCGVAAREGSDVVRLDACSGHFRDSRPQLNVQSTEASPQVKILTSKLLLVHSC